MDGIYSLTMDWSEIDRDEFSPTELEILEVLSEGRGTPGYIAEEIGRAPEYVRNRLRDLVRLGLVNRVHRGLYEIDESDGHP